MIAILRGDDTTFQGNRRVRVNIVGNIPLTGCSAVLTLCGVEKSVADVSTGTFYVDFTAAETAAMPCGVQMATVAVYDAQSHRRTATNTLCVNVTDRVGDAYRTAEESANVSLDAPVRWVDVLDAPTINGVALSGDMSSADLGIKGIVNDGGGAPVDLPENYTPDQMRTLLNRLAALVRASMQALAAAALAGALSVSTMAAEVEYARLGSLYSMSNVVTRVDLSGLGGVSSNDVRGIIGAWASSDQGEVTRAGRAIYADSANNAENATYATSAGSAQAAVQANTASVAEAARAAVPGSDLANQLAAAGLTTNDVCAIVTNSAAGVWSEWSFTRNDEPVALSSQPFWYGLGWDVSASHVSGDTMYDDIATIVSGSGEDATALRWYAYEDGQEGMYAEYTAVRFRRVQNALGIAMTNDLPQNVAVPQLLLKGEDGKTWKIWVNASSELKITEVE